MKILNEKEIEEASMDYCRSITYEGRMARRGYADGASFAEQKLIPLFVEFADYCNTFNLYGSRYTPIRKTNEQLFEHFVKERNKKK